MTLTDDVKRELTAFPGGTISVRSAEVTALLRFAGGLHIISGRLVIEAELASEQLVRRVGNDLVDVFGVRPDVSAMPSSTGSAPHQFLIRVRQGEMLARQAGLIDLRNRPVQGLPNRLAAAPPAETAAVWRGAFLAQGALSDPGRSGMLEVLCPSPESAMALVGGANRIGVVAKAREVRAVHRVVIRDSDAIGAMLARMGAPVAAGAWDALCKRREVRSTASRLVNFDDANLRRSAQAAAAACARVKRALEILGPEIPEHLRYAGELRMAHPGSSLDELGHRANPAITKDAVAGRIRRLLAMADKRARDEGIPGTEAAVPADLEEFV